MSVDNICFHPWVGLDIGPQGEFKPCCKYQNSIANNIDDYYNSKELADLKDAFSRGERPTGCQRCWSDEDAGHPSKRLDDWKYIFNETVPNTDKLKVLMFAFGNSCNLACRTCNSYSSSTWIIESRKVIDLFPDSKIYKHQRFYQDIYLLDRLKSLGSDITELYFHGGEPFIAGTAEHLDFLKYFLTQRPENITLHYMTNVTIFPQQEFWDIWKQFKKVNIQLSIDGIGSHFEYTRWPAKWTDVELNINQYKQYSGDNIKLSVGHVISIFTVYYLPEFYKWLLQNKFVDPFISLLADPEIYNIKTLPKDVKDRVAEKLTKYKFDTIIQYMYSEDLSGTFGQTAEYTRILDQQRNQNFENTFPEFNQLLKESGCQI